MKKIITNLAGFILIIAVSLLGFTFTVKKFLNVDVLSNTLKDIYHASSSYNDYYFTTMINGSTTNDTYKKYFNEEEIENYYTLFFAQYLLYENTGIQTEKPDFNELKEAVDGYLAEYEKGTGLEADRQGSFKFFYNLDQNMANIAYISKNVKKVVTFLCKDIVRDVLITIILTCIVIIIMLNRDLSKILMHIATTFISNGIGLFIIKFAVDKYLKALVTDYFLNGLITKLNSNLTRLSIICLVIGFVALLLFILYKVFYRRKEKPQLAQMTTAAIPNYERPDQRPINDTPIMNNNNNTKFFANNSNNQPKPPQPEMFIPGKSGKTKHKSAMSDALIDMIVAENEKTEKNKEEQK